MRKLSTEKRTMILSALVEGNSINATSRMCGVAKLTVLRLLNDVGQLCRDYHDLMVRGLSTKRVQADEIWSFVGCKDRAKKRGAGGDGDCWTWIAIDSDSKLVISYFVGHRNAASANEFMSDVADRIDNRIQLTSDGFNRYPAAVEGAFGGEIDYAMLIKIFGLDHGHENRYSPEKCVGSSTEVLVGKPDPAHICTSYVERQNLTLRMGNRRFTRLTNGFSKKWTNHEHAIALHYFHYNFIRRHKTLKTTPAVASGVADREWTVGDLVNLLEQEEQKRAGHGRINKDDRS